MARPRIVDSNFRHGRHCVFVLHVHLVFVKRRIIDPAVKELTQKDGWLIQWEPIKAGRKVKAVRFTFIRNPQGSLFNEQTA